MDRRWIQLAVAFGLGLSPMAALAVESAASGARGGGGGRAALGSGPGGPAEVDSRPLSVSELKQAALSKLSSDKNIRALKMAANAAATTVSNGAGQRQTTCPTGRQQRIVVSSATQVATQ